MSAYGPGALQTIARKLIAVGYDPDRMLDVHRGGDSIARLPLRDAARDGDAHD
jgi:hypoxanthine phosphoribosyltransferase